MGTVWLGRFSGKHGFAKDVAIKTIRSELADDPRFRTMFLDEARINSRLVHGNVAQILDVGDHAGVLFIVFEWVQGSALECICRASDDAGAPLPTGIALRIVADACAGLHAAHELRDEEGRRLRVVHRDVTPGNVLVSEGGVAKVIDFGVAKARDRLAGNTRSGIVKGTLNYMAPEQASGGLVDRRADIWALGAVLFRALAGRSPFATQNDLADFLLEVRGLPGLPAAVPSSVRDVVTRAMARHAADRFATADEMRAAVERALVALGAPVAAADVAAHLRSLALGGDGSRVSDLATATTAAVTDAARVVSRPTSPASPPLTTRSDSSASSPSLSSSPSSTHAARAQRYHAIDIALLVLLLAVLGALAYAWLGPAPG